MPAHSPPNLLDRFAEIGDLAVGLRKLLKRILAPLGGILFVETGVLFLTASPGAKSFALIALGSWLALYFWGQLGIGLPILPMLALQNLIAYGLPIVVSNQAILPYPEDYLTAAGLEVLVFSCCLIAFWRIGMVAFNPASRFCYALQGFNEEGMQRLERLGFGLIIASTTYQVLESLDFTAAALASLPAGASSILNAVISGVGACGFFLVAMILGKGRMPVFKQCAFWGMLALGCFITAGNFLLSSTITVIFSALIGLFWSNGRVPWRFLLVVLALLSFLNLGKFTMRERYWKLDDNDDALPEIKLPDMPAHYQEWFEASYDDLFGAEDSLSRNGLSSLPAAQSKGSGQSMLDRVNNLQNVLFVIDAEQREHISPLVGATYTLIPPLLVPRIFWPDKPRAHEGQVLLNVHFLRQAEESSFQTYIAWGLLAEAYGNFGPIFGSMLLGCCLGLFCAWVEKYVARKLLLSMEGFLSFTLFLGLASSFEMVSSVLVTSLFQSLIPVIVASAPFVKHIGPQRRAEEAA